MDNTFLRKKDDNIKKCTLFDYIADHHNDEDMRKVFLNMDIAMKYIHEHGYCIEVFYPSRIQVLENMPDHIQFDNLMELSKDFSKREDMIREDIFNSALIQIGLYTNSLNKLTPDLLRENFDAISTFIPEKDVPYYRGVVERGATVYFTEYTEKRIDTERKQLERELDPDSKKSSNDYEFRPVKRLDNDRINDKIYHQINGLRDVAFINQLLIPALVLLSLFLIALFGWVLSNF